MPWVDFGRVVQFVVNDEKHILIATDATTSIRNDGSQIWIEGHDTPVLLRAIDDALRNTGVSLYHQDSSRKAYLIRATRTESPIYLGQVGALKYYLAWKDMSDDLRWWEVSRQWFR